MIAIIDFGMGNLGSVKRKLSIIGTESVITSSPDEIRKSAKIILPGVGHFSNAVQQLKIRGIWDILNEEVLVRKKPVLGICLGMQLMTRSSEEGGSSGFGWFDAHVIKFNFKDKKRYKVPHIGWNTISLLKQSPIFSGIPLKTGFYFVHSYYVNCTRKEDVLAETFYESGFISAIQRENIFGVQFHPEKSHQEGEQMLKNFVEL